VRLQASASRSGARVVAAGLAVALVAAGCGSVTTRRINFERPQKLARINAQFAPGNGRIVVRDRDGATHYGTGATLDTDGIRLFRVSATAQTIAREQIDVMAIRFSEARTRANRRRRAWMMFSGLLAGAAAGFATGHLIDGGDPGEGVFLGTGIGSVAGAGLGMAVYGTPHARRYVPRTRRRERTRTPGPRLEWPF